MKKIRYLLTVLFLFTMAVAAYPQMFSMVHDGLDRTYLLHLPPEYDEDSAYPLVINMHGLGSNAYEQLFYSQFNQVGDTAGIILVYPNGYNNTWNIAFDVGVDDVGFISALIDTLSDNYNIDQSRVYATGMSMGGFMSHRLACQLNDRIAAIASVTGTLAYPGCNPERPVPVLQIHGTADSTVPSLLVPPTMGVWINQNDCLDTTTTELPDTDTTDQCTVTKSVYAPCDDDVEVILYTVNGGGHTWPGAPIEIGVTNYDIDGSVEIWNFFRRYTLPEWVVITDADPSSNALAIYPQPADAFVTLQLPHMLIEPDILRLFDISGRQVRVEKLNPGQTHVLSRYGLQRGLYLVQISSPTASLRGRIIFR